MALAAVAKRQKPINRSSPVKSRSGVFPRRPSGSKPGAKTAKVPLFVPDEEDDAIPQAIGESEGDEWEDFDGELEEDVQMSIAIAESLESQHLSRRISDTQPSAQTPVPGTPVKPPQQANMDNNDKAVTDEEDEFTSPSRLATQLAIAGARKPLSARIPSDSVRGTAAFATSTPSVSPKKPTHNLVANLTLGQSPARVGEGDTGGKDESDEDDMEEVQIPQAKGNHPHAPDTEPVLESPGSLVNPVPVPTTDPVETPLAIGVEDAVAKRFAEFQKIFAEKRRAFRAENPQVQEEVQETREMSREESPGLEYADDEVDVVEVREREQEAIEVRSSPPQSDEDEDMEEVEIVAALPSVPSPVPQSSVQSEPTPGFRPLPISVPAVTEALPFKRPRDGVDGEDEEDVPISDWSRSPSPQPRPLEGETGPSTSGLALDRSRGLLDPDESFDHGPSNEQDQEHEDFDAAHEMDPDAEAGEFARWMSQVKGRDLDDVRKEIEQEINGLRKEQKAAMRDSEDITGQMIAQIMVSFRDLSHWLSSSLRIWIRFCYRR
jgi:DNA excision repair protein ERCC-5